METTETSEQVYYTVNETEPVGRILHKYLILGKNTPVNNQLESLITFVQTSVLIVQHLIQDIKKLLDARYVSKNQNNKYFI